MAADPGHNLQYVLQPSYDKIYLRIIVLRSQTSVSMTGLGFCRGKKHFCQDSGKTGKNRQKLVISLVH